MGVNPSRVMKSSCFITIIYAVAFGDEQEIGMPRFFAKPESFRGNSVNIVGDDAFHIARSLRMAVGDKITVADTEGYEYSCILRKIRDDVCECEVGEKVLSEAESPVNVTLFMAYPKGDKLELVIQKAVELGANKIVPFESSRCVKRPREDKVEKQSARLLRIAEEAAKQCGRARLSTVAAPLDFDGMLAEAKKSDLALFCYEGKGTVSLKKVLLQNPGAKSISVVVGCEGGFSENEADEAKKSGLVSVNLGPRILRCETAPLYAIASISYNYEL